ncbi:hypothetical protein Caci_2864 [Catenulispora acidiphila DSM 44928]|uniref:Uncharacterized protein n=1 Tax=Catenulispora acidiphila (strain DSM 44928 / JCM 14897 / NBRC 102108 / NRRL B-24433 / ID139908) TaxID=479433 RepID=C7Q198_CATAD|nr:hypothetical protein [Catenulispora acidiphila]ACU71773.1 hypothetical protein Caci_2864 [Catenulispora acidiphila DSM 44928]
MPKDQINFPETIEHVGRTGDAASGEPMSSGMDGASTWYEPIVNVRWHAAGDDKIGNVQVSLQAPIAAWTQMGDELRKAEEKAVGWEEGWMPEAYSPSLSRSELNRLIRTLRRARDQAYGRDE